MVNPGKGPDMKRNTVEAFRERCRADGCQHLRENGDECPKTETRPQAATDPSEPRETSD